MRHFSPAQLNDYLRKSGCSIINQDDCIAINDATNIVFTNNSCTDGHGISIGSIKTGDIVNGVTISNNLVVNNKQGVQFAGVISSTSLTGKIRSQN